VPSAKLIVYKSFELIKLPVAFLTKYVLLASPLIYVHVFPSLR